MGTILSALKDKKFRYGTFSTVMILFAVAIFMLVNLVAGQFNYTRDLTRDQMFSLSRSTKDYLAGLNQDVTIYALFRTGQEHLMLKQILDEYASHSPHIKIEYRDPMLYPAFVQQFATTDERVSDNSIIVVGGERSRVIPPRDMFTYEFDYNTWQEYLVSIDFEPQITRAIHFVTLDNAPMVYYAMGSGEMMLPENLIKRFDVENYTFNEIDLVIHEIPEDCDILLLTMPGRDWSADKAERILAYLQNEGRALFLMGYHSGRFANLDSVLAAYGVRIGDYIVIEGDSRHFYMGVPGFLIPGYMPNEITRPLIDKRFPALFVETTGVDELPLKKASTTIEPIVVTSNSSYGKSNMESETVNKEPGDTDGPFNLAVMVTDSYFTTRNFTTKMVVFACNFITDESANDRIGGANWDLILNSLHWLSEQPVSIHVPSKSPSRTQPLNMTQAQANTIAAISAIGLPLFFVATGLVVWYRRRHS